MMMRQVMGAFLLRKQPASESRRPGDNGSEVMRKETIIPDLVSDQQVATDEQNAKQNADDGLVH
jgi:hypothetical protein